MMFSDELGPRHVRVTKLVRLFRAWVRERFGGALD